MMAPLSNSQSQPRKYTKSNYPFKHTHAENTDSKYKNLAAQFHDKITWP